jgi:hypothetical protein
MGQVESAGKSRQRVKGESPCIVKDRKNERRVKSTFYTSQQFCDKTKQVLVSQGGEECRDNYASYIPGHITM